VWEMKSECLYVCDIVLLLLLLLQLMDCERETFLPFFLLSESGQRGTTRRRMRKSYQRLNAWVWERRLRVRVRLGMRWVYE
jgi:hypothetical protein